MISFNKNQPKSIYKLNVALVTFFAFWFTAVVAVMVTIGCIYGESVITYAVMAGGFAFFFIGLAVFWLIDNKLHKRLIEQRTAELEKEFSEMPLEEAERILKERGIITDNGFVVKSDGVFGSDVAPFDKVWIDLNYTSLFKSVNMEIVLFYKDSGKEIDVLRLDRELYNFLANKDTEFKSNPDFDLLIKDKKEFATQVLKYCKTLRLDFSGRMHV